MVNVIGLGYIGLPTALMLASHGISTVGTDCNTALIDTLRSNVLTFSEEGMSDIFEKSVANITFSTEYVSADMYIVAVPTPYNKDNKQVDTCYVQDAIQSVVTVCPKGAIICIESTISPGTIDKHIRPALEKTGLKIGQDIHLVHTPERIIPGNIIYELRNNSRVIGCDNKEIGEKTKSIYQSFCKGNIEITNIKTAEMTKVVENTYRDINIAFANELMQICRQGDMDVYEIIRIANMHPRVSILQPGPGVGGHCISVDPWFLVGDYPGLANIILAARKINDSMPEYVLSRIRKIMLENNLSDVSCVGLYGLTYKENVDDVRESPSLQLIEQMHSHLASGIKSYDPFVKQKLIENQYMNFNEFLCDVDLVVIMVAHDEIKLNMECLTGKLILDTKNICELDGVYKL